MIKKKSRNAARLKRHFRIRNKVSGTAERPRLCVFRSGRHMYAQIIDDKAMHTLCAASTLEKAVNDGLESTANVEAAKKVGEIIAKKAVELGISQIVFDRGGYLFHGKVKALADSARENGLQF